MQPELTLDDLVQSATQVFGSAEAANAWLHAPAMALDHRRPIDLASTIEGRLLVHQVLMRIDRGVYT